MQRVALAALLVFLLATPCVAQGQRVYTIDTVVGGAVYNSLPATSTPLNNPIGLWMGQDRILWLADSGNQVIRRMDPATGLMSIAVGAGMIVEDSAPVPGVQVRLQKPSYIAGDAAGNIFFTDTEQNRVRKLTPDGQVTTIAGTGEAGFAGDGGPARLARLNWPTGLAFDAAGNLHVADSGNCRVRRVDTAGNINTIAGNGQCRSSGDGGPALSAGFTGGATGAFPFEEMQGLAFDSGGNLYVATPDTIRRIDRVTGIITTVAGIGNQRAGPPLPDGSGPTARAIQHPKAMLFDPEDNLYFTYQPGLAKLSAATGLITNLAGAFEGTGLVSDSSGNFLFGSAFNNRIRRVGPSGGTVTDVAGTNEAFDGPGRQAVLSQPYGLTTDAAGSLYISEGGRLRRFDPATGLVTTVAGVGSGGLATLDAQGNIFFTQGGTISKMDARSRTISRVAGGGASTGDGGPALQAALTGFWDIVADAPGNVFISETNFRIRRVDAATGIITTVAGDGTDRYTGDGGPGTAATVGCNRGLALDGQGNLLIAQPCGKYNRIRRLNLSTGIISTVQGRSDPTGPLEDARLEIHGITVDKDGNIFGVANGRVWQVRASDGLVERIAGSAYGFFGDGGPAALARLNCSGCYVVTDTSGNVYVTDQNNQRLRRLTPTVLLPVLAVSPGTVFFTQIQGSTALSAQVLNITSGNSLLFNWTLEIATSAGGSWLTASRTSGSPPATVILTVDASRLGAGTYRGTVTIRVTDASNSPQTVEVVLTVQGVTGAVLGISQQFLSLQAVLGGANPSPQSLSISNTGSGTLSWSATAETSNGGLWLKISPALGTAPSALNVSADISGLAQGVYQGRIIIRNLVGSDALTISVVLNITRSQPILLPTQTGFLFVGLEGSLVVGPQSFAIQNAGQGRMDWQIQVNLPGGGDWLRVSPVSGTSEAGQTAPLVTLLTDPSKLRAGVSVGLLAITAPGALNAPQTAIVLVNMLPRGSLPVGTINPLGLIFTSVAGAGGALTQGLTIATTGGQALQFLARAQTQAGGNWLSVTPEQGVLLSSSETASLSVQARPAGLAVGVYFGTITLSLGTGITQEVAVALVVAPGATASAFVPYSSSPVHAAACTARRLVIVETKLGNRFSVQVGWPVPMLVQTVDDCGTAVTTATVTASFTGGEPPVAFQNLRDGNYSATWVPSTQGSVGVTIRAINSGLEDGVAQFSGALGVGSTLPLVYRDGWVNAASFEPFKPLAPGMIFSLFGNNLAEGKNFASVVPLPRTLGNLKVSLGGIDVPLFYSDGGQVNAQVPFELSTTRTASLVATGRGSAGAPGTVTLVGAQPGVFTISQSGTGQGVVVDAQGRVANSTNPVRAGDAVVIYATGLGLTNPAVDSGASAPASPLANVVTPVKVTIGGRDAVVDFAGLSPGFVGLYQVNARVPAAVTVGSAVPLILSQNGVASNTVTMAVR